jgi:hypothetical protein
LNRCILFSCSTTSISAFSILSCISLLPDDVNWVSSYHRALQTWQLLNCLEPAVTMPTLLCNDFQLGGIKET